MIKDISGHTRVQIRLPVKCAAGLSYQQELELATEITARTVCTAFIWTMSRETGLRTVMAAWSRSASG